MGQLIEVNFQKKNKTPNGYSTREEFAWLPVILSDRSFCWLRTYKIDSVYTQFDGRVDFRKYRE